MRKKDLRGLGSALSLIVMTLACLLLLAPSLVLADPDASGSGTPAAGIPELTGDFKSAIIIDAETGLVLAAAHEREQRQPASMLKMMTELIVLEHVAAGDLKMTDLVRVSAKASKQGGSQVYLKHNTEFSVLDLLRALAIQSANDAAVALAEHLAGSTEAFVDLMNLRAGELGMNDTRFQTVHGLPPERNQEPDLTTAHDLALLGRELIRHPEALEWGATKTAPFQNGTFTTLYNPNKLIGKFRGLDGLKTGFTEPAGFCVTATAVQKGKRLISVVMGCSSDEARATETSRLLSYGFNAFRQVAVIPEAGVVLEKPLKIKGGKKKSVQVVVSESLTVSVPQARQGDLVMEYRLPQQVEAPLAQGAPVGEVVVLLDGRKLGSVPLVLAEAVEKGNWWNRLLN